MHPIDASRDYPERWVSMVAFPLTWGLASALAVAPGSPQAPTTEPAEAPTTAARYDEIAKAQQARPLTIAAGATAGAGVLFGLLVANRAISQHECRIEDRASRDPFDDGGGGLIDSCTSLGMIVWPLPALAISGTTTVLSAFAGDRWARADAVKGMRLPQRAKLAYTLGGIGLRMAGAAILWGGFAVLGDASFGCPEEMDPRHMRCYSAKTFGSAALITGGAAARWAGTGMLAYGVGHFRIGRRALTLRPGPMGISGTF